MVEVVHKGSLHLPEAGLWLDPREPRPLAFVSHAHSDHTGRHERTIATPLTLALMHARMGGTGHGDIPLPFGETLRLDTFSIRLLPAGHVLGSAQCHVETASGTLLYTGDFKLRRGASAETAEHVHAETLVMETTYGLPRYVFPPSAEVVAAMVRFCHETLEDGMTPVLLGYSLGKAQEILASLEGAGLAAMLHPSIAKLVPIYRAAGIGFPVHREWDPPNAAGHVVVCPPTAAGSRAIASIGKRRVAAVTGWAMDPGAIHRLRCDAVFPLSDHAGYDDLVRHVERVNPRRVLTLHGFASQFAADLRARGIEAWALTGPNQLELPMTTRRTPARPPAPSLAPTTGADGFGLFCSTCEHIAAHPGRMAKTSALASYLRSLDDRELELAAVWLGGRTFADGAPHHVGRAIIRTALIEASGMPEAEFRPLARGINDSGITAETAMRGRQGTTNHPLERIHDLLMNLRSTRHASAKIRLLVDFFTAAPAASAKFMVKILSGDLRIGLKEGLVEEALAKAFDADPAEIREAIMLEGDPGAVALMARHGRLHARALRLFRPVKVMLAAAEPDAASVAARFPTDQSLWAEPKFDGVRAQIHAGGGRCAIHSRDLKDMTAAFPEIAEAASRLPVPTILDAEIVAWRGDRPLPFFELQRRLGRKEADLFMGGDIPVVALVFDILMHRGETLLRHTLAERRKALDSLDLPHPLVAARVHRPGSAAELDTLFEHTRATGHEGLMVKDPDSRYTPGRRGLSWIKFKKRLATLDAVVTAAEFGHGKRRAVLSDYTFSLRDGDTGGLAVLGKAYTGLTDAEIAELTDHFLATTVSRKGNRLAVEPLVVLEIAFDSIRPSKRHSSGLALRFPRIARWRRDKTPEEIDTVATARRLVAEEEPTIH
jgi:DNA ligase 1